MAHPIDPIKLSNQFRRIFGARPRIFMGPGRINIIGEHVDYCGGLVMPAAIDRACFVAIAANDLGVLRVDSDFGTAEIALDTFVKHGDWRDYIAGVAFALIEEGVAIGGHDLLIQSNVPVGAGVSSSAALEVALGLALSHGTISGPHLAVITQRAENHFVGMNCGIMDQFASANGIAGNALLLNCATLKFEALKLPDNACFLLIDSGVKHAHVGGGYDTRRADCEAAARSLGVALLCDLEDTSTLVRLDGDPLKRARHVVTEIARTKAARDALLRGDLVKLGALMNQSHTSLSLDMEVSTPEVDRLAAIAQATKGVYGARMMGGGFGGSVIALTDPAQVQAARTAIITTYGAYLGKVPDAFVAHPSQGGHEIMDMPQ